MLSFGSLFSGVGGFDLGLERAGLRCAWQVERDAFCRAVLARHWPAVRRHDDVKTFPPGEVEAWRCDVVVGGFPCQPVSVSGLGRVQSDERWLWPDMLRVVRDLRPRYVLVENVAALLVRGLADVLGGLAAVGYDAEWESVPAAALGAPHLRFRVFLAAYPRGTAGGLETLFRGGRVGEPARSLLPAALPRENWSLGPEGRLAGRLFDGWARTVGRPAPRPLLPGVDDGPAGRLDRERAVGNAVVVPVAEWVGRRLVEFDRTRGAA